MSLKSVMCYKYSVMLRLTAESATVRSATNILGNGNHSRA
jgi:hypothetical protein